MLARIVSVSLVVVIVDRRWTALAPNASLPAAMAEMRRARDGSPYTWEEFVQWYGREANSYWNESDTVLLAVAAEHRENHAAEHGGNYASALVLQSTTQNETNVTEHGVILSLRDLQALARQQTQGREKGDLHREARDWLNQIADGNYSDQQVVDLTTIWPRWSAWLATQPVATQSFESDIVAFTAETIENTSDPNRGGRLRVDLCARLVDGSYWRFHPGSRERNSAKPIHIPATMPDATRGAAEHAAMQWTTIGQGNVWTIARFALVPQQDRMGKHAVWQKISALLTRRAIPRGVGSIDITDGELIPWWLWVSNLGHRTRHVIGEGIEEVHLSQTLAQEVVFHFIRVDNTKASLLIGRCGHQVYVRSQ